MQHEKAMVRRDAGVFDVSHMTVIELHGPDGLPYLDRLLANDIGSQRPFGKAMYSAMLSEAGCVVGICAPGTFLLWTTL